MTSDDRALVSCSATLDGSIDYLAPHHDEFCSQHEREHDEDKTGPTRGATADVCLGRRERRTDIHRLGRRDVRLAAA